MQLIATHKMAKANCTIIRRACGYIYAALHLYPSSPLRKRKRGRSRSSSAFIKSADWKSLRNKVLDFYGRVCMACGSPHKAQVDHIKPKSLFPELAMVFDNLQVLCWTCNKAKGNKHSTDYRK